MGCGVLAPDVTCCPSYLTASMMVQHLSGILTFAAARLQKSVAQSTHTLLAKSQLGSRPCQACMPCLFLMAGR